MKVLTKELGRILVVTINRGDCKNAIDYETGQLLYETFLDFDQNDKLDIAILTGIGNTFCAGADLKALSRQDVTSLQLNVQGTAPLGISRLTLSKPTIAAIEGYAVAGGLEIALWCDLRVGAQTSVYGVFCRRFGVPLVDGGTVRLPRLIGQSRAMDMILTGRPVYAKEAFNVGLINRLAPEGESLAVAIQLAEKLSALPQTCMRSDRMSMLEQWALPLDDALINETKRGMSVVESGETLDGAKRFVGGNFQRH